MRLIRPRARPVDERLVHPVARPEVHRNAVGRQFAGGVQPGGELRKPAEEFRTKAGTAAAEEQHRAAHIGGKEARQRPC